MHRVTSAAAGDLHAICALISDQQGRADRNIPYLSNEPEPISKEVTAEEDWTERSWVVRASGRVVGFLMAEVDEEIDRMWWMGPFAENDWAGIADILYLQGRSRITVSGEELAGGERHMDLAQFADRHGFRPEEASVALRCEVAPTVPTGTGWTVAEMTAADRDSVAALHDLVFPGTHTTGRRLVEKEGDRFWCLVARGSGSTVGYVAVEAQADGSGYIDFVGVTPEHRRDGLGRLLVAEATNTLLERGCSHVHLTVRESNGPARRLYAALGFVEDRIVRPYRKGFTLEGS